MSKEVSVAVQQHAGQIADVISMKATVQDVLKSQMQEDVHYGKIPGTGDKPTLLKAGAEMLRMVFNMSTICEAGDVTIDNDDKGHKTYEICMHILNKEGIRVATGLGTCSTMESKYKYRSQLTDRKVPSEYWESRDKALLGGPQYSPKKVKGSWLVSERVEHDNPADYYNTVKKMAKKRAMADGILTATCSSDLFTQDLEDLNANFKQYDGVEQTEEKKTPVTKEMGLPSAQSKDSSTTSTSKNKWEFDEETEEVKTNPNLGKKPRDNGTPIPNVNLPTSTDSELNADSVKAIIGELYDNREDWPSVVKAWPKLSSAMMLLSDKQQKFIIAYKDEIKAQHRDGKGMI